MNVRHFVTCDDMSTAELIDLLALARRLKRQPRAYRPLLGRTLAMIFEKPSLRTRVSFETGMCQLGGHPIYLAPSDIQIGAREAVQDVARNLSRLADGIMARTFAHETVVGLARHADVPVINGLSDLAHPCQGLADVLTIDEHVGLANRPVVAYIGDGNNVCHSLMVLSRLLEFPFRVGCPAGYEPAAEVRAACPAVEVTTDPAAAVAGAAVVYTDVWVSMGDEETAAERLRAFTDYQVNAALMSHAAPDAVFMHCLPAKRGLEVTDEVLDGPRSVVYDQAENRLHAQKALLVTLLAGGDPGPAGD